MGVLYAKVAGQWEAIPHAASSTASIQDVWPAGSIRPTIAALADIGWLLFGQTVANAQTLYPMLWNVVPTAWKSGSSLVIPSDVDCGLRGSSTAGLGAVSGTNTKTIATANLPVHAHSIDHDHPAATSSYVSVDHSHAFSTGNPSANHDHGVPGGGDFVLFRPGYGTFGIQGAGTVDWATTQLTGGVSAWHTHSGQTGGISANHTHSVDVANHAGNSGNAGSGTALNVQDAAINVRFQIKAH